MSNPAETSQEHQEFTQEAAREQKTLMALSRCLDSSKIRYQSDYSREQAVHAVLKKLQAEGVEFKISDRNWCVPYKGGQAGNLQNLVDRILMTDTRIGDTASVQAAVATGELTVEAKSDLKTLDQKNAYIRTYGLNDWEKLPLHRSVPVAINKEMTAKDYFSLGLQARIDLQKTISESELGQIIRRK